MRKKFSSGSSLTGPFCKSWVSCWSIFPGSFKINFPVNICALGSPNDPILMWTWWPCFPGSVNWDKMFPFHKIKCFPKKLKFEIYTSTEFKIPLPTWRQTCEKWSTTARATSLSQWGQWKRETSCPPEEKEKSLQTKLRRNQENIPAPPEENFKKSFCGTTWRWLSHLCDPSGYFTNYFKNVLRRKSFWKYSVRSPHTVSVTPVTLEVR